MVKHNKASSEIAHGLFLLGQKQDALPYFHSYCQLMEKCAKEGDFLSFESHQDWLSCYEKDAQHLHSRIPLLVFRPHTVLNIAPFIRTCYELSLPVTVRCGGTGLAGSCVPSKEGVVLLTGHLKQIKEYDSKKGVLCVEPGVTLRQIHRHIAPDFWQFPLSMVSEGVAGLAGCLSSHSRGYHQQGKGVFEGIDQVMIVDGKGDILEVPGSLMCGSEGLWGVIIELNLKLKKKSTESLEFIYPHSWQEAMASLPSLRSLPALAEWTWFKDCFYLRIEGESWRLPSAAAYLKKQLPGIQPRKQPLEQNAPAFFPSQRTFVAISSVFHSHQLQAACTRSFEQAQCLQLECLQMADVLAGSLHLILEAKDNFFSFQQKIEQFLIEWADFVDCHQGVLASCHGVGMQMGPYMPPFWTEETQGFWHKIQSCFDPKNLFGQERFFPAEGKSLEKARMQ